MKYEDFIEVLREVSESKGLNSDNILKRVQDKLKERSDENGIDSAYTIVYNTFKSNSFYKNHEFKLQMSDGTTASGTLLHFAIQCNNELLVKLLLENELSIVMKNHSGLLPLHIAASHGYEEIVQLLLDDKRVNPLLGDAQGRTPKDVVGTIDSIQNKEIIVKRLETAEKNYSPKKTKDLNIKIEGGGCYRLSQNNHKTQAGLAVNVGNVTSAPANVIDPHLERCDSIHSDGSVSGYSSLESEQSETTSIRKLENELKKSQENPVAVVDFSSKRERELNDQLNRSAQERQNLESEVERLSREVNRLKEQQTNTQRQLDDALKKLSDKDSRIQELESSDEELKRVEQTLKEKQKDLEKLKGFLAENETRLKIFDKPYEENKSLKQKVQNLESKNAKLNSELEKNKDQYSQTSEVSLKKVEKKPPLSKVAYVSLVATSVVGSILSIVSGLFVLSMIATSVTSALVAGGITYTMSKPTTELKEVAIEGLVQHGVGEV